MATREQDVWRAVEQSRVFEGSVSLSACTRLVDLLAHDQGECMYALSFEQNDNGWPCVHIDATTTLPLMCQRSLEPFDLPVRIQRSIGLMRYEDQEKALPPEWEGFLVPEDGYIKPLDLLEDELIFAIPAVPINPEAPDEGSWSFGEDIPEEQPPNPFSVLETLKTKSDD